MSAPISHRLTHRETAAAIGTNLGGLVKLRSKGAQPSTSPINPPQGRRVSADRRSS